MCNLMFAWETAGMTGDERDAFTVVMTVDPLLRLGMERLAAAVRSAPV